MLKKCLPLFALFLAACTQTIHDEPVAQYDAVTGYGLDATHGLLSQIPTCGEAGLWRQVRYQFNGAERDYNTTGVLMGDMVSVTPKGAHIKYDGKVARGWCEARVGFSDNKVRRVVIEIGSGTAFAGTNYGLHVAWTALMSTAISRLIAGL